MVHIITPGDENKKVLRPIGAVFTCENCGCRFLADKENAYEVEALSGGAAQDVYWYSECPNCRFEACSKKFVFDEKRDSCQRGAKHANCI